MFTPVVGLQVGAMEIETDNQTQVVDHNTPDQKVVNTLPSSEEIHQPAGTPVSVDDTSSSTDRNDDLEVKMSSDRVNGFCIDDGEDCDSRPPLSDELHQGYRILQDLMADSNKAHNYLFMDPVDSNDPETSDYYQRIQDPMCLRTMLEKFDNRKYTGITEFYDDFMLMIKNCWRYWGTDHKMGKKAERFHTMFQQKIALLSSRVKEKMTNYSKGLGDDLSSLGIRRRGRSSMTQDGSRIFQQVRQEREQEEKEMRLRQQAERKAERKAQEQAILDWDKTVLFDNHPEEMKAMWEIPQIQTFLWAAKVSLNLEEINIYETERAFYMPQQSSTLHKIMTSLLSTPAQRERLGRRSAKPMSYKVWSEKLQKRVALWYKALRDCGGNQMQAANKVGIEKRFFRILGVKRNPLEKKAFHELTTFQRVWVVKSLCDNILETQEEIREAMEQESVEELRGLELGQDAKGFTYIHFPQFCGPAVRFYRQAPIPDPTLDSEEEEEEEENEEDEDEEEKVEQSPDESASSLSSRNSVSRTSTPQPVAQRASKKRGSAKGASNSKSPRLNGQQAGDVSFSQPGTPASMQDDCEEKPSHRKSSSKSKRTASIRGRKTRNGITNDFDTLNEGTEDSIDRADNGSSSRGRTCNGFNEGGEESSSAREGGLTDQSSDVSESKINSSNKQANTDNLSSEGTECSGEGKVEPSDSKLPPSGSGATGTNCLCNGDSQGREGEEDMDWEVSAQPTCGGDGQPSTSPCTNSNSPQVKQEHDCVKTEAEPSEGVKVKMEPGQPSDIGDELRSDANTVPRSGNGEASESAVSGTAVPKNEPEEASVKQEAPEEEESDTDDVEIKGPKIGAFELIIDSVEGLRQFIEKLEEPETVVSKKGKRKVTKQVPRKRCEQELAARLRESVKELTRWEGRLNTATSRARMKIRREFEEYKPEESLLQESNGWDTDSGASGCEGVQATGSSGGQPEMQEGTDSSMDVNMEVKREETESPVPMEYEIEYSSRGRMRKRKTNPDDRPAKRPRTSDGSEDPQSASRLPNILQRQVKTTAPTISILSPPGRAGLPGSSIQVAVSRPDSNIAQFSASQLLKLSLPRTKAALAAVPDGARSATLLKTAPGGGASKTGSHPVIQELLSKQPQFRGQAASSLLPRQTVVRPKSVVAPAASPTGSRAPGSSSTANVQYIITHNSAAASTSSSGTPRAQQALSLTPELIQQLLQSGQIRLQTNTATGATTLVLAAPQQPPASRTPKTPQTPKPSQTVLLSSQSVSPPTPPSQSQAVQGAADASAKQQGQQQSPAVTIAVGAGAAGQKGVPGAKYASNVTVKALLENRAAQKAGVPAQGAQGQLILTANSAGVPTLLSRIQPAPAAAAEAPKLAVQVPSTVTKTFSGDLDSAVRLVVTSVNTSLPTANIHVPSPTLSPNLVRGTVAHTIMTSVMEQPIVTTKVKAIASQATSLSRASCLTSPATAQAAMSMPGVKVATTPALGASPSPQKTLLCKVMQPDGQQVFQIIYPQGSLQHISGASTAQLSLSTITTTAASSAATMVTQSSPASTLSPTVLQVAAAKAQLAGGLRTTMTAAVQPPISSTSHALASPTPAAAAAAKQLTLSPQSRLLQAPAAALVKQLAASQLAQTGSVVRVQGGAGNMAATTQAAGSLPTAHVLQQLSPGAGDQAAVGQPAVAAPQAGQILKVAGLGKAGLVLNISPNPASQQRVQAVALQSAGATPSTTASSASPGSASVVTTSPGLVQVPQLVIPQQSSPVLNLQLLQNKLSGLAQNQAAASAASQPTRMVLVAQPGTSQQASPQFLQQLLARGVKVSAAGQPQIVLTPSAGSAAVAKAQVLGQGLAARVNGGAVSLVPVPSSVGLGVAGLAGLASNAATAPGVSSLTSIQQTPAASSPAVSSRPAPVAAAAVSPGGLTGVAGSKPSTLASAGVAPPTAAKMASPSLPCTQVASNPTRQAAAATASSSSSNTSPGARPAAEGLQTVKLLKVGTQLYTPDGIPVTMGSDGQLRSLPLPRLQISAQFRGLGTLSGGVASGVLAQPAASGAQPSFQTSPRVASSTAGLQPAASVPGEAVPSTNSQPVHTPQQQQQRRPVENEAASMLMNLAQGSQSP